MAQISFDSKDNADNFCRFFSNFADSLLQNLSRPKNKFRIKNIEEYYKHIQNESEEFVLSNVGVILIEKIFQNRFFRIRMLLSLLKQIRFLPSFLKTVLQKELFFSLILSIFRENLIFFLRKTRQDKYNLRLKKELRVKLKLQTYLSNASNIKGNRKINSRSDAGVSSKK